MIICKQVESSYVVFTTSIMHIFNLCKTCFLNYKIVESLNLGCRIYLNVISTSFPNNDALESIILTLFEYGMLQSGVYHLKWLSEKIVPRTWNVTQLKFFYS